jgi:hypothetical protein
MPRTQSVFVGGADSAVARTVGHAEGTRTADGDKTRAYYGHSDPGNGVWNLGSFSFQHCREARYNCTTPEAADTHQLQRLQGQTARLNQIAVSIDMKLTLPEKLNGIDLANQAPLAAIGMQGYVERLQQAKKQGLTGSAAILWARTWAFWDSARNRWDAPGLGNSESRIQHDQERRMLAIARALNLYRQQKPGLQLVSYNPQQALHGRVQIIDQTN